jgi:hypothetical protein
MARARWDTNGTPKMDQASLLTEWIGGEGEGCPNAQRSTIDRRYAREQVLDRPRVAVPPPPPPPPGGVRQVLP